MTIGICACGGGSVTTRENSIGPNPIAAANHDEAQKSVLAASAPVTENPPAISALQVSREGPITLTEKFPGTGIFTATFTYGIKNSSDIGYNNVSVRAQISDTPRPRVYLQARDISIEPLGEKHGYTASIDFDAKWLKTMPKPAELDQFTRWYIAGNQALNTQQRKDNLEGSGVLTKLDRTDSLAGVDADGDGVRDDIAAILGKRFQDPKQLAAAMREARAMQSAVVEGAASEAAAMAIALKLDRAYVCLTTLFPPVGESSANKLSREIESMTTNTPARLKAYLRHDRLLSGKAFDLPSKVGACDE